MAASYHPEKGPYLRDLQAGAHFIGYYLVRSKTLEPFRDPSRGSYLTLGLSDASGQMIGRVWEDATAVAETVEVEQVVKIEGDVDLYQERPQIRVLRIRPARKEEYDRRDFLPSSARDPYDMLAELDTYRKMITTPALHALVDSFFDQPEFLGEFMEAPATRQAHHAYLGGLLEHTLNVLRLCRTTIDLYPTLDASLLLAGALLFQVGKLRGLTWQMSLEPSDAGLLIGDIVLTDEMVSEAIRGIPDFPADLGLRLRHMLVSYRGGYEMGSPRYPQTLEAIALHQIEELDARLNRFQQALASEPPAEPGKAQ